ncbi:hypothetical protein K438DRAFT_1959851 [Mycena galopus ATCC 62051]|nr:hypothetical protein K438DRAFT_1959851 [Mycena galopus ATCC 62051]
MDLWPLTPTHVEFWLHCLWASRVLVTTGAIVVSTWSEVVDATVGGGFLGLVWRGIPEIIQTQILSSITPDDIAKYFSRTTSTTWIPNMPGEYIENIGILRIVQVGPQPVHMCITAPTIHAGAVKHDGEKAYLEARIITL